MGANVGFDRGFSVVTLRAGLALVGKTSPVLRVVVVSSFKFVDSVELGGVNS